ncbi:MAG TPA: alpha/beta hydrolase [Ktedonobacterales bacterium]|nr:alpha/beta hydrolase [Ktedonobacterales bacterium]
MTSQQQSEQSEQVSPSKRRRRGWLVWLGGIVAVLLGLTLLGALYEGVAEAADIRAYPAPGQMVDVGGYRLHINCVGTGSPTVVIDAGLGDWSASWSSWVQPDVARTTRVCAYDRAGLGWSEAGPLPRTAERFTHELHTLLHNARVPGPYVLVGHSSGGLTVRVFAHEYAAEVAGVVLVESMHPSQAKPSGAATPRQATAPASELSIYTLPARIGLVRLLAGPLQLASGLSPEVANAYVAFSVTPRSLQTSLDEGQGMPESLAQAAAVTSFGTIPLIVLSRGGDRDQDWQRMQSDLLRLSSNSRQLIADQSGHNIQLDQPKAAVGAIVTMVEQIRRQAMR